MRETATCKPSKALGGFFFSSQSPNLFARTFRNLLKSPSFPKQPTPTPPVPLPPATELPCGSVTVPRMLPYTACANEVGVLEPHARQTTTNPTQIDRLTITSSLEKFRKSQPCDSPNVCLAQPFPHYLQND